MHFFNKHASFLFNYHYANKRFLRCFLFLFIGFKGFFSTPHSWAATAQVPPSKNQTPPSSSPFTEWLALGSGCRAKHNLAGDVLRRHSPPSASPFSHVILFELPHYAMTTSVPRGTATPQERPPLAFAKECALRITLEPGAHRRIKNVSAQTTLTLSKPAGTLAAALVELKLGAQSLSSKLFSFSKEDIFVRRQEEIVLFPGKGSTETMPNLGCGEAKILGIDYSFQSQRSRSEDEVHMSLGGDKTLKVTVDTEACGNQETPKTLPNQNK